MHTPYPMKLKAALNDTANNGGSWEVSCQSDMPSIIGNGAYAGQTLADFLKSEPAATGTRAKRFSAFPMLVKLISCAGGGDICLQVSPSEACVPRKEKQYGKTRRYIIEYFIPAGTEYAVCKNVTRCEALENGEKQEMSPQSSLSAAEKNGNIITHLAHDKYFSVYELRFGRRLRMTMNERSFNSLTFISGKGTIECGGAVEEFAAGQSFFIPCPASGYVISGAGTAVMCKLEGDNIHKSFDK